MKKRIWIMFIIAIALTTIILMLIFVFFIHNSTDDRKYEVKKTELAPIKKQLSVSIKRYEKDIFTIPIDSLSAGIQKLYGEYPEELIEKDVWHHPEMIKMLKEYLEDPVIQDIYTETMKVFPNLDELTSQLTDALTYYQYYFPKATIPHFYTLVSGIDIYSPTVLLVNNNILIHLDMYLGFDCNWYNKIPNIPKYISEKFDKKYLPIDCFKKALIYQHLPDKKNISLLDYMIEEGKKLYFTELMFPNAPEQDIIGYSDEKFKWAEKYQYDVWNYIINHDELFSKSDKVISVYIDESPFTKVFQNSSPGRLGAFIGWKLIKSYMNNNPNITLNEMINHVDSKDLLNQSRYKPTKR
jgi:hypothetical protein